MDYTGFRKYLQSRDLNEEQIEQSIAIVDKYNKYVAETSPPESRDLPNAVHAQSFSLVMVDEKLNTYDNFLALARYAYFTENNPVYITFVELFDGSEVISNLHKKLAEKVGEETRDEIFEGIEIPVIGTPAKQKPATTFAVMERLESNLESESYIPILKDCLRDLDDANYLEEKKKFHECANLDAYLDRSGSEFIAYLEGLNENGRLYFTQEITDEVIDFVRNTPEIAHGVREGNILYQVKIPYMTKEYLSATEEKMKRYYYCHCPWVRESLLQDDYKISPAFCQCSAGFQKKQWEVIYEQSLGAEMVESILQGDPWCKIAIQLPEEKI